MNFFVELKNRWNSESPKFHKILQKIGNRLTLIGVALVGIPAAYEAALPNGADINLKTFVLIASYIFLSGLIITAVAGTAVKNPDYETLDKKNEDIS